MKVLHLTGEHEDAGGVLSVLRNLQTASSQRDSWEFRLWVRDDYREVRSPSLNYERSRHAGASDRRHFYLLFKSFLAYRDVRKVLLREHFDVVHAHTRGTLLVALWLAMHAGIKVVFTNHNFARRRWLYRRAAKVSRIHSVMLTPNMACHYRISPERENVSLISACYADELLSRQRPNRFTTDGKVRLVGVGNIVRWKNWHLIIQALRQLPVDLRRRFEMDHWGPALADPASNRYQSELLSAVGGSGLGKQFRFHGMTTDVYSRLDEADWFILPSTNEPCSVALMEALACGVPAVVSRSGGSVDILREGITGAAFKPDDAADLARVLALMARGELRPQSAQKIRESVRERSASAVLDHYATLYHRWRCSDGEETS